MRVGSHLLAGSRLRSVLLLAVLLLALPASAGAQEPTGVVFEDPPADVTSSTSETLVFSAGGAESFECALDEDPFEDCAPPVPVDELAQGSHTFQVRALDAAGELLAEGAVGWVVDLDKPGASILTGPSGPVPVGPASFTFESTAADLDRLECQLDDDPWATCTSPLEVTAAPGPHVLRVRAIDEAGNVGDPASRGWTAQAPAPAKPSLTGPVEPSASRTATFTFSAAGAEDYACTLDGAPLASCTSPREVTVESDGSHTFSVSGIAAGGTPGPAASLPWTVDTVKPTVTFTSAPPAVSTDLAPELTFTAGEEGAALSCSLDGAPFAPCASPATVADPELGAHAFEVRATDAAGNTSTTARADWTTSFAAAFDWAPAAAVAGQPVTFTSRAKGAVSGVAWDLDDDGAFDDGTGVTAQRTFDEAGSYRIRLRVTHRSGRTQDAEADVAIGRTPHTTVPPVTAAERERRPPVAAFGVAPQAPVSGQEVTLSSTSSDPDGTIAATAWDLDGDGEFDDATGPAAARAFGEGTHLVGLRVVDSDGLAATAFATVVVGAAPAAPGPPVPAPGAAPAPAPAPAPKALALLKPFPTVRIAGTAVGGRIQLRIFAVKAPRNTTVDVRCRGRGCPFARDRHRIRSRARVVRIRRLERRALRAGIVIEVRVHAPGRVGKYTRLQMRAGAAPKRTDACVSGPRALKTVCPA